MNIREQEEQYFYQPTQAQLEAGLSCEDPECSGHYVPKRRDLTLTMNGIRVTIKDTEYWECDICGAFVTSREETVNIRKKAKQLASFPGRLTLRMDSELHHKLSQMAQQNRRSLNNEILYRLEKSLED